MVFRFRERGSTHAISETYFILTKEGRGGNVVVIAHSQFLAL